jgi:signal transduction histidine kinase
MESQVRGALRQRARLAGLGAAVAKLAHDLRNSLATAQLVTETLAASDDPKVRQTAPRLERVIARAGGLAEAALR